MTYLSKNYKKINIKKRLFIVVVFFALILCFYFGKLSFLAEATHFIGRPVWIAKNYSAELAKNFIFLFKFKNDLMEENEFLKNELTELNLKLVNKKLILIENEQLKEILGRKNENQKLILANIISKPILSPYNSLILDIGKNYEIKKGDKVLVGSDIIIGEIEEVYYKTAKVKLYSFAKDKMVVAVGFEKILSNAEGKGGGVFEIKLPNNVETKVGDTVTLPEMDLMILGIIEDIVVNPEDPFQTILFKSPVNIFELRWVQILQE
ncbi:MAG: rod shape-determining protein MreC [Patescibacteria group bacterium]